MIAYIQTCEVRADGTRDSFRTESVPARESVMPWQAAGKAWTASGYGRRTPTPYTVQWRGRWRRVYACQISNVGTLYIGRIQDGVTVSDIERTPC